VHGSGRETLAAGAPVWSGAAARERSLSPLGELHVVGGNYYDWYVL
jgi:hypothetical protein